MMNLAQGGQEVHLKRRDQVFRKHSHSLSALDRRALDSSPNPLPPPAPLGLPTVPARGRQNNSTPSSKFTDFDSRDLADEIKSMERAQLTHSSTPRCSAPNAVEMAIGGSMAPVAFLSQEKRPLSGLARESRKVPPFSTKACPVAVAPRPQRQPLRMTLSDQSVWLPRLNLGALGLSGDHPISSPDRTRSVSNILSPRSAFSPRTMSPRVGYTPSDGGGQGFNCS